MRAAKGSVGEAAEALGTERAEFFLGGNFFPVISKQDLAWKDVEKIIRRGHYRVKKVPVKPIFEQFLENVYLKKAWLFRDKTLFCA